MGLQKKKVHDFQMQNQQRQTEHTKAEVIKKMVFSDLIGTS